MEANLTPMFLMLGGVIVTLGGALVLCVKMLLTRMEKKQEASDGHIVRLIKALERTVSAFDEFKREEHEAHGKILDRLHDIDTTLRKTS